METKLNSLRALIEKFLQRVEKAREDNNVSKIELDIMLDLLRQAYTATEELTDKTPVHAEFHKSPVVQVVQPAHNEKNELETQESDQQIKEPVTSSVYSAPSVLNTSEPEIPVQRNEVSGSSEIPEPDFKTPEPDIEIPKPDIEIPKPEIELPKPERINIDDVPVMSFPKVEVTNTPEKRIETPPPPKPAKQEPDLFGGQTLADKLKSEKPSLNEKITQGRTDHSLGQRMQLKPITDLRTAIGINEKFQFVNDLFDGRIEQYNDAITNLNNCNSGMVADNILYDLKLKHSWNEKAEAYSKLKNFVARRYM